MKRLLLAFFAVSCAATMMAANDALSGKFSIAADKQVYFSPGNLQFHMQDSLWRFAPNQFDWCGNANLEMGNPDYNGWVDLLSWSIGEANNYGATSNYDTMTYVNKSFVDWGTLFGEGEWFSLSHDEWNYLLNTRSGANDKWGMAKVGDTLGMILLPDTWTAPEGITFVAGNIPTSDLWDDNDAIDDTWDHYRVKNVNMPANLFTLDQWAQMEAAGAVFLPYAGRRSGGYGNYLNTKCIVVEKMFRYSYYENYLGTYWTSTLHNAAKGQADYVYTFKYSKVGEEEFYDWGKAVIWSENGRYGQSVRLVQMVKKDPTGVEEVSGDGLQVSGARKMMVNGKLLIERSGEFFSPAGQKIQ